jgi:hypothetical protein
MGLTHYWLRPTELPAEAFAAAVWDVRRVLDAAGIPLAGFDGRGRAVFLDDTIVFNGVVRCEPFEIHQVEFDRRGRAEKFSFCKTHGLPYDLAVKATLIVLKHHLGKMFKVMSDESDDAWERVKQLVVASTGFGSDFNLDQKT